MRGQHPARDDERLQAAMLCWLLDTAPGWCTMDEAVRCLGDPDVDPWVARDEVERAARDLAAAGLAHRMDRFVTSTLAARRCADLLDAP